MCIGVGKLLWQRMVGWMRITGFCSSGSPLPKVLNHGLQFLKMKRKRREFLKLTGQAGLGIVGGSLLKDAAAASFLDFKNNASVSTAFNQMDTSLIGLYGPWAASLTENKLPSLSLRKEEWANLEAWRKAARNRTRERMAIPQLNGTPQVTVEKQYTYDGLHIEEVSWQLPYGRATEAILLKPFDHKGRLPGVLAFHDHGGNKYFGTRKITRTSDEQHPMIPAHQQEYYQGKAWANELAKRGYVVLVPDAFTFGSRRVQLQDVPEFLRNGLNDNDPEQPRHITAYNQWAGEHEHIMAKSL